MLLWITALYQSAQKTILRSSGTVLEALENGLCKASGLFEPLAQGTAEPEAVAL